jgi:DnaA-homolog protein
MRQLPLGVRLRETARFSSFVAGDNDELFERLTNEHAPTTGVWIWGRPGAGKTHLLQATCAAAGDRGATAAYFDLAAGLVPDVLDGIEAVAVACLDGLELVSADAAWNAALFRLHTLLQEARGRLVVASGPAPATLEFALPDLRSRLLAADVFQLHELGDEGLVDALQRRAAQRGLELSADAAAYLLQRLPRDMHTLCHVLDRLDDASLAAQRRLTLPFVRTALAQRVETE